MYSSPDVQGIVYYRSSCPWECDYVGHDILTAFGHWPVRELESAAELAETAAHMHSNRSGMPSVVVFNNEAIEDMMLIISLLKPRVLI